MNLFRNQMKARLRYLHGRYSFMQVIRTGLVGDDLKGITACEFYCMDSHGYCMALIED